LAKRFNIRAILSLLLELAGLVAIVYGFWLIFPFLGFIIGGVSAILIGLAIDPPIRRNNSGVNR
jgi:ABC-type phosphate transport system permease subunit